MKIQLESGGLCPSWSSIATRDFSMKLLRMVHGLGKKMTIIILMLQN